MSQQHATLKANNQQALYQILTSLRYLCRQGLSIRGDGNESDGNFNQLLQLKSEGEKNLTRWLKRKENVYTSPEIQNELIKLMGIHVLRSITQELQKSPYLTIMADETTDASNEEQLTIVLRQVTEELLVHEEFIGLYKVPNIEAATIFGEIQDVLKELNIPVAKLRGQCYDGASAMSSSKRGVAKLVCDLEERAIYTHCYGHALNLAAGDTLKQCKLLKDALETTREITKLIKYSPRREEIFERVKEEISSGTTSGIRVLCPTRWTVRANSLDSVLSNYESLLQTWEEAVTIVRDTETKARIQGVEAQMKTFEYVFGCMLGELILRHSDNLSSTLQHKSISAAEGQRVASMTIQTFRSIRNDESYDLFWKRVDLKVKSLGVSEPQLPRRRKAPKRYEIGSSAGDFHENPEDYYRQVYYQALDLIINCIEDRFDQPGYRIYKTLELLLVKACKEEDFEDDLQIVCGFYRDDFIVENLRAQLKTFGLHFKQNFKHPIGGNGSLTIFDVKDHFLSFSSGQMLLLSEVKRLLQLVLVMPATNASSERSFSALRRIKTYLRTTMGQDRLKNLMLLHVHKERTDALDLRYVVNEFVGDSEHRLSIFAKYKM